MQCMKYSAIFNEFASTNAAQILPHKKLFLNTTNNHSMRNNNTVLHKRTQHLIIHLDPV